MRPVGLVNTLISARQQLCPWTKETNHAKKRGLVEKENG